MTPVVFVTEGCDGDKRRSDDTQVTGSGAPSCKGSGGIGWSSGPGGRGWNNVCGMWTRRPKGTLTQQHVISTAWRNFERFWRRTGVFLFAKKLESRTRPTLGFRGSLWYWLLIIACRRWNASSGKWVATDQIWFWNHDPILKLIAFGWAA